MQHAVCLLTLESPFQPVAGVIVNIAPLETSLTSMAKLRHAPARLLLSSLLKHCTTVTNASCGMESRGKHGSSLCILPLATTLLLDRK
jgi:hypothetical protein